MGNTFLATNFAHELAEKALVARSYSYLYYICRKKNDLDSADAYCRKLIPLLDKVYDKSSSLTNIGCMYLRHGDLDSAKLYLKRSLDIEWRYNTAAALSDIYLREGKIEEATNMRDKALKTANPELKKEISNLNNKLCEEKERAHMRLGRGKAIYDNIMAGNDVRLKGKEDRTYLIEYYSIKEYKTFHQWSMRYTKLTVGQIVFLILCDMGIGDDRIKAILGVSDATMRANKSKLKSQIFTTDYTEITACGMAEFHR